MFPLIKTRLPGRTFLHHYPLLLTLLFGMIKADVVFAQSPAKPVSPLVAGKDGLVYNADPLGNRIPDFSFCGYMASEEAIPTVPVKIVVPLSKGDATQRIQSALDYVASLPAGE